MHNIPFTNGKHNKTEKREKKDSREPQQKKCKNGQRQKLGFAVSSSTIALFWLRKTTNAPMLPKTPKTNDMVVLNEISRTVSMLTNTGPA